VLNNHNRDNNAQGGLNVEKKVQQNETFRKLLVFNDLRRGGAAAPKSFIINDL